MTVSLPIAHVPTDACMRVMLAQMDRSTIPSSAPTQTGRGTPVSGITEAPRAIIPGAAANPPPG